ncbi:cell division protein FtsN [Neisseria animalis]|uniref:Cell division protein FtsN n=1 Tax=Neisseria animalis TaxID=492 RepID=A0A5P3MQF3_NEIAN|nr:cell division protein FtsN [Neisseria animalis]QEY23295.1 cell division protein FtsN [Neisseria animalis]ROW31951.1 cell division protein FtsN [Neisseria animalis]VEE08609.1 tetrapac protein [Neisseria animalis]
MSDDKQTEVLTGYEQLKRRNRRRLVAASGLVVLSGIMFAATIGSGGSDRSQQETVNAEKAQQDIQPVILEPASAAEPVEPIPAAENRSENADGLQESAEILKPQTIQGQEEPAPLVLINDKLVDSDIKGLEESERLLQEEAAKRAAEEKRAEERRQRLAEQRAAKREAQRKEAAEREAAAKKRAAERKAQAEKAAAERKQAQAAKAAAERKAKQEAAKKEAAKTKQAAAQTSSGKSSRQDSSRAEKPQSSQRAAIQAGYAEKERAQSLQRKMKAAGINSKIIEINTDNGKVYRVKSEAYKSREAAGRDLEKLRVHGIGGAIVNE